MRLLKIILLSVLFFSAVVSAQQLYFCKSFTEDGKPIDARGTWKIKPWGTQIYVLFDNEGKVIENAHLYLFIDKLQNGEYKPFDSQLKRPGNKSTWTVFNVELKEPGDYKVYVLNPDQKELASGFIKVEFEEQFKSGTGVTSSRYYDGTKITFCEAVISGKPIRVLHNLSLSKLQGIAYAFVKGYVPFNTKIIIVQVWKDEDGDSEYEKLIDTKKYQIDPHWKDTFFKYQFKQPGKYMIKVFNENEIPISSAQIEITK